MNTPPLTDAEMARLREVCAQIPYVQLLGIELLEAERGAARLRLPVSEKLTRMQGIMHGGAIASLIDTASAFAVITLLEAGQTTVTVDLTLHYLRPVLRGAITAHARVLRAGRRIVIIAVDVMNDEGELTATALTTYAKSS